MSDTTQATDTDETVQDEPQATFADLLTEYGPDRSYLDLWSVTSDRFPENEGEDPLWDETPIEAKALLSAVAFANETPIGEDTAVAALGLLGDTETPDDIVEVPAWIVLSAIGETVKANIIRAVEQAKEREALSEQIDGLIDSLGLPPDLADLAKTFLA